MNQDIPFEHQMMFFIRDYDRKVEENMELRKEVEELSAALEKQGVQLYDAKVDLKMKLKGRGGGKGSEKETNIR